MSLQNNQPVGCTALNVVATTGEGTREDVEGYYVDAVEVTGIAGGDEIQLKGCIERGAAGVNIGPPINANGIYAAVNAPWVTDMPLTQLWTNKTVDGSGTPVVTAHLTRRY